MIGRSKYPHLRRLIDMETGDLVQVRAVPPGDLMVGAFPLRDGEVLQCIDNRSDGVVVARPDGSRLIVEHPYGETVQVHLFWEPVRGWISDDVQSHAS